MGAENRIEDTGEEGNRSLGKMHISGQFTGLIFKGRIVQDEFQEHFGTQLYIEWHMQWLVLKERDASQ